jgi:hypothetical protein
MSDYQPLHPDESAAANGLVTSRNAHVGSANAENPFVWLLGIGAFTLGLIGFSTHVRVANIRAGVDAGAP